MELIQKITTWANAKLEGKDIELKYANFRKWYEDSAYSLVKSWCQLISKDASVYKFSKEICEYLNIKPDEIVIIERAWRDEIKVVYLKRGAKIGNQAIIKLNENNELSCERIEEVL